MALRYKPNLKKSHVREHPLGIVYVDVFQGPADQATAQSLAPDKGTLRGSLPGQGAAATAPAGARVQRIHITQEKPGMATEVVVEYLEVAIK